MASENKQSIVDLTKDEESPGKPKKAKMKQMRLPFATIDKNSALNKMEDEVKKNQEESKKRKHSADDSCDEAAVVEETKDKEVTKVRIGSAKKKAKTEEPQEVKSSEIPTSATEKKSESMELDPNNLEPFESSEPSPKLSKVEVTTPSKAPMIEDLTAKSPDFDNSFGSEAKCSTKLTPKQLARKEEFEKKRLEKERLKEEARLAREQAKEEERRKKEAEKKEKEAKKEQERLEKERAKKEKEEEKERLRKEKEEEKEKKRKEKEEQKELEKKQKEEADRKKQEEKEEKEKREKEKAEKLKKTFVNFFVKKEAAPKAIVEKASNGLNQFHVKADMRLAPIVRAVLEDKSSLDSVINSMTTLESLYVNRLKSGLAKASCQSKTWPFLRKKDDFDYDDIEVLEDEDDEIGDEIKEENLEDNRKKITKVFKKAKLLQFHDNQRPAYFGTWSKKSSRVCARRPLAKDCEFFDYDYDSDDDWEEEEEGESLSDEEKDKEEDENEADKDEDDNDDDGFFVGHGVLDKDELKAADEDEEIFDEELEMKKQKLKAQQFEEEYKKKKPMKLKPRVFGCFWNDPESKEKQDSSELKIAYDQLIKILTPFKAVPLIANGGFIPTSISNPKEKDTKQEDRNESKKAKKVFAKQIPEAAMPDLIKLVHANTNNKVFLAKEFGEFWNKNNGAEILSKGKIIAKIQEVADYQRSETLARKCWLVKDTVLEKYGLTDIEIPNKWEYLLEQPNKNSSSVVSTPVTGTTPAKLESSEATPKSEKKAEEFSKPLQQGGTPSQLITKFTKVLSEEEKLKALTALSNNANNRPANPITPKAKPSKPKAKPEQEKLKALTGLTGLTVTRVSNDSATPITPKAKPSTSNEANAITPKRRIQPTLIDLTKN